MVSISTASINGEYIVIPPHFFDLRGYRMTPDMIKTELRINEERGYAPGDTGYAQLDDLMLQSLGQAPTDRQAANTLGILGTTFSHWLARMGITGAADKIRIQTRA